MVSWRSGLFLCRRLPAPRPPSSTLFSPLVRLHRTISTVPRFSASLSSSSAPFTTRRHDKDSRDHVHHNNSNDNHNNTNNGEGNTSRGIDANNDQETNDGGVSRTVSVSSTYIAPLDIKAFAEDYGIRFYAKQGNVLVNLDLFEYPLSVAGKHRAEVDPDQPVAVLFEYGSVVFFNASHRQREQCLRYAQRFSDKQDKDLQAPKDDFLMVVRESAPSFCDFSQFHDQVIVKRLDLNCLRVTAQVLAQTVALDYYEARVGRLLSQFREWNEAASGGSVQGEAKAIIQHIAANNIIMTDVHTKLKLLDKSEVAWKDGEYSRLWEGLREEFNIYDRFNTLETKLSLLRDNTHFFLEVILHHKGLRLERIIIGFFFLEVVLHLLDKAHIF